MPNRHDIEPNVVEIVSGRNAYQLYLMTVLFLSGISIFLQGPAPNSIEDKVPYLAVIWAGLLVAGSVANLTAVLLHWKDRITGMELEAASCLLLALAGTIYTYAVLAAHRPGTSWIGVAIIAVLLVASAWRGLQLVKWVRKIKEVRRLYADALDAHREAEA